MRTLCSYWEELKGKMEQYDGKKVFVTLDAKVCHDGQMKFIGFVSLGNNHDKQTGIHGCASPEELIQKAEAWAKIITMKLEVESKDVAL